MQNDFNNAVLCCTEINYFVSTWGKQAKTQERKDRRITVGKFIRFCLAIHKKPIFLSFLKDENKFERSYFRYVVEHKDVIRAVQNLANGLLSYKSDMEEFQRDMFERYKYLWSDDREDIINSFVLKNPLTVDIRDMFLHYDNITLKIETMSPKKIIGPIEVRMESTIEKLVSESKKWKVLLGQLLSVQYKKQLDEMIEFITEQNNILDKPINDLDDVRQAMVVLEKVRDNYIE